MAPLEYHRPKELSEALELLKRGVPLAGGTRLTPNVRGIKSLVDLQDLGLDGVRVENSELRVGGAATLQAMVEAQGELPDSLVEVCRLEAGWNIRNKATVAGTVVTGDGRSPLLAILLALGAEIELAPGSENSGLDGVLDVRAKMFGGASGRLITEITATVPSQLKYVQVARSPADRPQVCVAAAFFEKSAKARVALGGYGARPILLVDESDPNAQTVAQTARAAYADAGDQWASGEYRADVAATLAERVMNEL